MLKYILRWWIMEENMLWVCREKRECEWVDEWVRESRQKNYLSNSEDTTISLTVCCETICVKKMGDLQ